MKQGLVPKPKRHSAETDALKCSGRLPTVMLPTTG